MSATQGNLAALSRYIFKAPSWETSIVFALVIAAITGVAAFDSAVILQDAWEGIFFIGIPTVVASFLTAPLDQRLGGKLTYNRSSLLALTSEIIVVFWLTVSGVIAFLTPLGQGFVLDSLLMALAFIFAFRQAVMMAVSHRKALIAALPASIQTVSAAVLLFIYSGTLRVLEIGEPLLQSFFSRPEKAPDELLLVTPKDFFMLATMCVLYAAAVWGMIKILDRPWRRGLGVSGFDFIRGFIGHIAEDSRELETFFETIGEEAIVPVTVLAFRRSDGSEKARVVLPMIHPGPMGEIGGGNLPVEIAKSTNGLAFPPHATAGHDFNLVTESEVDTVLEAMDRALERIQYDTKATHSSRETVGEVSVLGQAFGNDGLFVTSFSPRFADDVEYSVGLSAIAEGRAAGLDEVVLIDAHNCNDGLEGTDLGHVTPGSQRSFDLFSAIRQSGTKLADADQKPLELGVAWEATDWEPSDGIGPLGIRVAVLRVNGQETAYVLIDGNNMEPGLRDWLIEELDGVDVVEIMTTDTHVVNTVDSVNQVGEAIADEALLEVIQRVLDTARDDYEPVSAGVASEQATVTVFGNDRTETLASHANAVISMGGALAGAVVLAIIAISVLLFLAAA